MHLNIQARNLGVGHHVSLFFFFHHVSLNRHSHTQSISKACQVSLYVHDSVQAIVICHLYDSLLCGLAASTYALSNRLFTQE